jgi:hypothetical protein
MYKNNHIQGRSGCKVEITTNNPNIISKYSKDRGYNSRLTNQLNKQLHFFNSRTSNIILTPEVKTHGYTNEGICFFDMEYINGQKFSNYFVDLQVVELENVLFKLLNFINIYKINSQKIVLPKELFIDKLDSINNVLTTNNCNYKDTTFSIIESFYNFNYDMELPVCDCHGDLTFSNMLFKEDHIFIFDFLDSFVDSYLIDIVKIRQDTSFYWSILMDADIYDSSIVKLKQIMDYFDNIVHNYFSNDLYYRNWYKCLQNFNLLRILPYVKNENEIKFIENALINLNNNHV